MGVLGDYQTIYHAACRSYPKKREGWGTGLWIGIVEPRDAYLSLLAYFSQARVVLQRVSCTVTTGSFFVFEIVSSSEGF